METKLKEHYYCSKCGMPFDTCEEQCKYHEAQCGGVALEYNSAINGIRLYYLNKKDNPHEDMFVERVGDNLDSQYRYTSYNYSVYFHNIKDIEIALRKLLIYVIDEMCECAKRNLNVSFDYTPIKFIDFKIGK